MFFSRYEKIRNLLLKLSYQFSLLTLPKEFEPFSAFVLVVSCTVAQHDWSHNKLSNYAARRRRTDTRLHYEKIPFEGKTVKCFSLNHSLKRSLLIWRTKTNVGWSSEHQSQCKEKVSNFFPFLLASLHALNQFGVSCPDLLHVSFSLKSPAGRTKSMSAVSHVSLMRLNKTGLTSARMPVFTAFRWLHALRRSSRKCLLFLDTSSNWIRMWIIFFSQDEARRHLSITRAKVDESSENRACENEVFFLFPSLLGGWVESSSGALVVDFWAGSALVEHDTRNEKYKLSWSTGLPFRYEVLYVFNLCALGA